MPQVQSGCRGRVTRRRAPRHQFSSHATVTASMATAAPRLARFGAANSIVGEGSGQGLSIARAIAGLHHGQLEFGRSALGGARVVLNLPLAEVTAWPSSGRARARDMSCMSRLKLTKSALSWRNTRRSVGIKAWRRSPHRAASRRRWWFNDGAKAFKQGAFAHTGGADAGCGLGKPVIIYSGSSPRPAGEWPVIAASPHLTGSRA